MLLLILGVPILIVIILRVWALIEEKQVQTKISPKENKKKQQFKF